MGKGKGRQSGSFGSKKMNAVFAGQIQRQVGHVRRQQQRQQQQAVAVAATGSRPRFTRLTQLKGLLRERQSQEWNEIMERRRRNGFLPQRQSSSNNERNVTKQQMIVSHPPGWILYHEKYTENETTKNLRENLSYESILPSYVDYNSIENKNGKLESLQLKCVRVLGQYLPDYLEALGPDDLRSMLTLLPCETLAALSVLISSNFGITNEMAIVLGKHPHLERLSLHAARPKEDNDGEIATLTNEGINALIPTIQSQDCYESWEDCIDGDDEEEDTITTSLDIMQLDGCSVRLKRLELVRCIAVSGEIIIKLLSKCACITHLSLSGSLSPEDGPYVLMQLPDLLPVLEVLDISQCGWVSSSLIQSFGQLYVGRPMPVPEVQWEGLRYMKTSTTNYNDENGHNW